MGLALIAGMTTAIASSTLAQATERPPMTAQVSLGIHNFQSTDAWHFLHGAPQLVSRLNCDPLMTATPRQVRASAHRQMEGPQALLVGCGSGPADRKYGTGPMSGPAGPEDAAGPGSAATPTVRRYTRWVTMLDRTLGERMWRLQVWNEANLSQFYRGSPKDLVDLTFAAARVLGRDRVVAPSFALVTTDTMSGGWYEGRQLTRAEFPGVYWDLLVARAKQRGQPLPVSAATYNGYGHGITIEAAARDRLQSLLIFRQTVFRAIGHRDLPLWDTEWNLRNQDSSNAEYVPGGFADGEATARVWAKSVADAACLGYEWQFPYLWTDRSIQSGWESAQIQLSPESRHVNEQYRRINGQTISCPRR